MEGEGQRDKVQSMPTSKLLEYYSSQRGMLLARVLVPMHVHLHVILLEQDVMVEYGRVEDTATGDGGCRGN